MFYLNQKQLTPALILICIIFLPWIIALLLLNIIYFQFEVLLVFLLILVVFGLFVLSFILISKSKKTYLILHEEKISINYPNINNYTGRLDIDNNQIIRFDYYKISSIKAWLSVLSFILPKCVYITYNNNGKEVTELIGHLDYADIKKIADDRHIKLLVH